MRFKIDISDSETGEVTTVEVEAPTAHAAREYLRKAGYTIWATEPVASAISEDDQQQPVPAPRPSKREEMEFALAERAVHGTFRRHPFRYVLYPFLWYSGVLLLWVSAMMAIWKLQFPLGLPGWSLTPGWAFRLAIGSAIASLFVGWPVERGRAAMREWADLDIVCRNCRRRGFVRTRRDIFGKHHLWGHCRNCGTKWMM